MALQILAHTPGWVFVLFAGLMAYGSSQLVARQMALARVIGVAIGMTGLGAHGVISTFHGTPQALLAAPAAALAMVFIVLQRPLPPGTQADPATRQVRVPGSVVPLVLMMGLFFIKYAVGVTLALHPELRTQPAFALAVSTLYGVFSGVFLGRAARLVALLRGDGQAMTVRPV